MYDYSKANLRENPFKDLSPTPGSGLKLDLVWGGLAELKEKILSIYKIANQTTARQVVLNWGPWGGGKTFTAYYFMDIYDFSKHTPTNFYQVYLRIPKSGSMATSEFFRNIIDFISFTKLKTTIGQAIRSMGEDQFELFVNRRIRSEEFTKAIGLIGSSNEEVTALMNRYIFDGLTKTELKKLGLARNLNSDGDYVKFLSGIILAMLRAKGAKSGKFIMWVDEMEDLIYFSQKDYKAFSQTLRDVLDTVNENLTVFFNFTMAEPEESTIESLLGGALWSRINKRIRFREMDISGAKIYCIDLINHFRIDKRNQNIPLDENLVEKVIKLIPGEAYTPREINKYFGSLINFSIEKKKYTIDENLVEKWIADYKKGD